MAKRGLCLLLAAALTAPAGGGAVAPAAALAAECNGDECQPPAPAPEDPTPGTAVVEGPQNPPVRFPGHHGEHSTKHHHRRHGGRAR